LLGTLPREVLTVRTADDDSESSADLGDAEALDHDELDARPAARKRRARRAPVADTRPEPDDDDEPQHEHDEPAATPAADALGWAIVAVPALGGVVAAAGGVNAIPLVLGGAVLVSAGCIALDADRRRMPGTGVVLALVAWILGYPYHLAKRSNYGAPNRLGAGLVSMVLLFGGAGVALARVGSASPFVAGAPTTEAQRERTAPEPAANEPSAELKAARMLTAAVEQKSLADAVAYARPYMEDTANASSVGAVLVATWAKANMTWADVSTARDETSLALVKKDSDRERGKRLCVSGNLVEIAADKSFPGKPYVGLLRTGSWDLVRFVAAGSTGQLVEQSAARFCGVVTGRYDYANSGGGVGHAVEAVGMFDLPENRATAPAPSATGATQPARRSRADRELLNQMLDPADERRVRNPPPIVATSEPAAPRAPGTGSPMPVAPF
jgi:hypothetical protein